ncbi:hypothetical protein RHMOL_Rhmol05G0136700 [Rhododendron molle]|uniref:Uncharacterized protein n=1 Tax=Rhododendron molle TaxID=49168 RepID=A0ACC0NNU7_RHOML|nr:hypothetical protein RHMOL_Rhmol05G0136700 [Rhododendron molle]
MLKSQDLLREHILARGMGIKKSLGRSTFATKKATRCTKNHVENSESFNRRRGIIREGCCARC